MMPHERGTFSNRFPQYVHVVLVRVGQCVLLLCWSLAAVGEDSSIGTAPARVSGTDATLGFVALASPREVRLSSPTSMAQRKPIWGHYRRELLSYSPVYQGWGGSSHPDGCPASWHTLDGSKNTGVLRGRKKSTAALELCHRATIETGRDGGESTSMSASIGAKTTQSSASLSTGTSKMSNVDRTPPCDVDIVKPERDDRSYRYLELPNQLAVVIISDRHTETAAASMFIRVGHMQDPEELPGMAHFHEHMLFLGTEKYPEEGQFEKFLSQHGGSSNAYTATESTNYFFDVESSHLEGALDRFSQFFQTPLFSASSMERELQAVDSEHSNNKLDDTWRLFQVLKASANQKHAFSKFGSGNYETLRPRPEQGIDTRASLIEFHEKYYSADAMKLCVLGKESLDTLEAWVRHAFSGVRNTAPPVIPDYGGHLAFGEGEVGRKVTVIPLKEARKLALSWPLPPRRRYRKTKPTIYISHLLGYEGEGGLHALLDGKGWITSLSAGSVVSASDFQLYRLSMSLTQEGERHIDDIIDLCHRFLALLKERSPEKRIQDELASMASIRFRFLEKTSPTGAVQTIASALGDDQVDPAQVLYEGYSIPEWSAADITDVLARLSPRNCQILIVSREDENSSIKPQFQDGDIVVDDDAWRRERWYGTSFKVEKLSEERLQKLESLTPTEEGVPLFKLPGVNEFIPTDFALRADDDDDDDDGRIHGMEKEGEEEEEMMDAMKGEAKELSQDVQQAQMHGVDPDPGFDRWLRLLLPEDIPKTALEVVPREDWSRLLPPTLVATLPNGNEDLFEEHLLPVVQLWHKMDQSYRVPRSVVVVKLWTPEPYGSPEAAVHARLFVRLLQRDLRAWVYDAAMADLRYALKMTTHGLQLSVVGFSSKVVLLLSKILGHVGELLSEYRELGDLLESGAYDESPSPSSSSLECATKGVTRKLTARQELLHQRFQNERQSFLRGYRNFAKEQPHETAAYYIRQVMEADVWHIQEYKEALEDAQCTPAKMVRYFDRLLTRLHVDVLAHGNVGKEEATSLPRTISEALSNPKPLSQAEIPSRHALRLPLGGRGGHQGIVVDLEATTQEENNSAVQVLFQVGRGKSDLHLGAALEFIDLVGYTSAFQQLRTQEQLGYLVYTQLERGPPGLVMPPPLVLAGGQEGEEDRGDAGNVGDMGDADADADADGWDGDGDGDGDGDEAVGGRGPKHPGGPLMWSIVVQSPDKSPAELEERIEAWIAGFRKELEIMPDEVFEATINSMVSSVLRRERSMMEEAQMFFSALASRTHDFYRRYRKADAYRHLTKESVLAVFDASLATDAPGRRKLSVRVASKKHKEKNLEEQEKDLMGEFAAPIVLRSLEDIRVFKANTPIYP